MVAELADSADEGICWVNWINNEWQDRGFAGHLATSVYLFTDGHAKALRPTATVVPFNMWGWMAGNTAANGPDCATAWDINCDVSPPNFITAMGKQQEKYN